MNTDGSTDEHGYRSRKKPYSCSSVLESVFIRVLLLLALIGGTAPAQALRQAAVSATADAAVRAVQTVGMTVFDVERAAAFYRDVLTFEMVSDAEVAGEEYERLSGVFGARARVVRMRLGGETIELTEYLAPRGRPVPPDSRSNDRWFQHVAIVVADVDRAYARLRAHRVEHASSGPQLLPAWNPNAGGIAAFYFKDPDGHVLEVIHFPPGKGLAKWQRPARDTALFLGIDHTAIVVRDTPASLAFYRDLLGLAVAGESENYGTEQEHLNNVFGARLRITSLRAPSGGPGIELLEYLAPRDGRPYPADAKSNDLFHWQTTLVAADPAATARALRRAGAPFVSSDVVALPDRVLGFGRGLAVKDPDGHVMRIVDGQ